MAGSFITVSTNGSDIAIAKVLTKLINNGQQLEPAFQDIGEYLLESHQARFDLEIAPDGELWEPLAPRTLAKKKRDTILREEGILRNTLAWQPDGDDLLFGSNLVYAATHQFGRPGDGIPQREVIGLTTSPWSDEEVIIDILQSHLLDAVA